MISLVPCKDRTRKYVMICMTSYMILVWNQGSGDPGPLLIMKGSPLINAHSDFLYKS